MKTNNQVLLAKIKNYVLHKMESVDAGHDISHIKRVLSNAQLINESEKGNAFLIEAGVLLHDITDEKLFNKEQAEKELIIFLQENEVYEDTIQLLLSIINAVSFGSEFDKSVKLSLEQKVVRDADRLDAIGAIGIARAFHYGGGKNRELFNEDIPPQTYQSTKEYRKSTSPTINHFYEKLLLLKDRMETETGKKMAQQRHEYMLGFLQQFYTEINTKGFSLE